MKPLFALFACLLSMVAMPVPAAAPDEEGPDLFTRNVRMHSAYTLNDDGSFVETRETATKVLKEPGIQEAKRTYVSYSTSIQKAEVLEAYTLKADGRRLDAPKTNYQIETNTGRDKSSPAFSDFTTLTVVFPEVAVGDTVVLAYRLTASEPIFPKHFSAHAYFPRIYAYDDVRIRIDAPASLWTQYQARQLTEVTNVERDGRRILEWTYANPQPVKSKREDYSVYDVEKEPGFAISTFRNHREIAEAYGVRARPKAAVTERVRKLADEIAGKATAPRDVAKALYDWVALNITYAGNCIGLGAVVPRDLDVILDNRMGDCKDHATLLQALLAARGIDSVQALVNSGSTYRLPTIPVVSMVNHVITYLPAFDLFADSTSAYIPFGMLPFEDSDKPVLLVDNFRDGARTPPQAVGRNTQAMKTRVEIQPDGSARGRVDVALGGIFAATARAGMRQMKKDAEADMVRNYYKALGHIGSGSFEREDPAGLLDTYRYGAQFEVKELIQYPGTGAFAITPLFYNAAPIVSYVASAMQQEEEPVDTTCHSGRTEEEYVYVLPKGMKLISVPDNIKVANSFLSYEATYRRKGNTLTVRRIIDDRTPGNVCSPQMMAEYRELAKKILPNLKAQVIYR